MPIQRRSINIGSVLGTLAPKPSETSPLPPPPRFSQGEDVMKKRKRGEKQAGEAENQQALSPFETPKSKAPKKGKEQKWSSCSEGLQVMFLTSTSTEMTRKSRGVMSSLLRANLWMKRIRSLRAKMSGEGRWSIQLEGLFFFQKT
uniref:Uncharacterized protein n=1 Tax=Fagus sylvatica TaxID=28930 RepID=A0A2N9ETK1_FAGSY